MNRKLDTDQDFADKDKLNKATKAARASLKTMVNDVQGKFVSYSEFAVVAAEIDVVLQKMQSQGEKQVKAAKVAKKKAIEDGGYLAVSEHIQAVNAAINPIMLSSLMDCSVDFVSAMKNKRTIESLVNAVDGVVAELKVSANELKDKVITNLSTLRELAGEHEFLFMDSSELVKKENEDLIAVIKNRISEHEAAEAKRIAEETARIEAEAKAKAEREAQAKLEAEEKRIRDEERAKVQAEQQAEAERIAQIKANDAELQKREQPEEKPVEQRLAERFADTDGPKKFKVQVEWSGYSRGYSVYEVEAESEEEALECYYEGNQIERNVVRDDTEAQEKNIIK
jgi:cell pole-organizing protein PopZ